MDKFLEIAYKEAQKAYKKDEVPVGAVLVLNNKIISKAHNTKQHKHDISGHAEINCIRKASNKLKSYILENTVLYVTLEPCIMCASAIQQARISKIYYGCKDDKNGGVEGLFHTLDIQGLNHNVKYENLYSIECKNILKEYFKNKRK